ncbi:DUF6526 family protein [Neobacillus sp. PS3-34]|uniref:DUF6526 family protein n=1 Tax=Neobacillus sp. PS3-34 TaxID=3070678 RepID=UPI0027E12F9E|nr:DUF6526 family protein [Neobacillus sp. PS3-34]WML48087.1 DUF6526 family protein [Neobacillus sp. PS3-34]
MKEQSLKNHARIHPPYHYVGSILMVFTLIGSIVHLIFSLKDGDGVFAAILLVTGSMGLVLTFALVRLYSLKVQDRVIRTEENFRLYRLTGKTLDPQVTIGQIIALRFANDAEFPTLYEKAINEKLLPAEIKKTVKDWRADNLRV